MTTDTDLVRIRLNHIERRVMQIEARLSGLPLSEPIPFPVTPRTTPIPQSQHYCNFCGKAQEEVASLIAGHGPIFICSECVELCHEIEQKRLAQHYCNFCGKAQEEVASLIAGHGPIFICSECVELCHEIEQKRLAKTESG